MLYIVGNSILIFFQEKHAITDKKRTDETSRSISPKL